MSMTKKWIYFPVIGIVIGELLMFYGKIYQGVGIHIINILAITIAIILGNTFGDKKYFAKSDSITHVASYKSFDTITI